MPIVNPYETKSKSEIWAVSTLRPRQDGRLFGRRHFQIQIHQWKCFDFDKNLTKMYSLGSNQQHSNIGSDNGLAPNRQQAVIWTNDGLVYWCIYSSFCLNEFTLLDYQVLNPGDLILRVHHSANPSPPGHDGCHFEDDIFRCIFVNEKFGILIKILLMFVCKGQIDNNLALF